MVRVEVILTISGNFHEYAVGPVCYYCKKRGHVMAECRALEKKNVMKKTHALVILQDHWHLLFSLQVAEINIILSFLRVLFPKAVSLRNIKIVDVVVKFFTFVGLPRTVQSDQGSNFMSGLMQQVMYQLGVKQYNCVRVNGLLVYMCPTAIYKCFKYGCGILMCFSRKVVNNAKN